MDLEAQVNKMIDDVYDIQSKYDVKLKINNSLRSILDSLSLDIINLINRCIGHLDTKSTILVLADHGVYITEFELDMVIVHLRKLSMAKRLLRAAQYRANKKNIKCTLDYIWVYNRLDKCSKTKIPFVFTEPNSKEPNPYAPSIDRIDNNKGYLKTNSRLVLISYNKFKCDYNEDDIDYIIKELSLLSL